MGIKIEILNKLEKAFLKLKSASHFMFILVFMLIFSASSNVFGESIVPHIETKINVVFDNQNKTFIATQNTVEGALEQGGIILAQNDITEPPRNTLLFGEELNIKVTRALPVLVSDEGVENLSFSAYSDPNEIIRQLNINVFPEDKVSSELILDPIGEKSVGQKVLIDRAPVFKVEVDGEIKEIRSWEINVSGILKDKIVLGLKDIVEPSLETEMRDGELIRVTRVNEVEIDETKNIPFETIYKEDYTMYQGKSKVIQEGVNGQLKQLIKIIYHNGEEIDRQVLSSETISSVTNKVILKGVKPYDAGYLWDVLVAAGSKYGVSPSDMYKVMMCESGGRVTAGGAYKGLFQWDGSFYNWAAKAGFPGADIYDPNAQIYATALRVSQNGWSAWGCKP